MPAGSTARTRSVPSGSDPAEGPSATTTSAAPDEAVAEPERDLPSARVHALTPYFRAGESAKPERTVRVRHDGGNPGADVLPQGLQLHRRAGHRCPVGVEDAAGEARDPSGDGRPCALPLRRLQVSGPPEADVAVGVDAEAALLGRERTDARLPVDAGERLDAAAGVHARARDRRTARIVEHRHVEEARGAEPDVDGDRVALRRHERSDRDERVPGRLRGEGVGGPGRQGVEHESPVRAGVRGRRAEAELPQGPRRVAPRLRRDQGPPLPARRLRRAPCPRRGPPGRRRDRRPSSLRPST